MYEFSSVSPRVGRVRARYRDTVPYLDIHRYRIVTEFYRQNRGLTGTLKRAMNFANLCEKMPVWIRDDELIVGTYVASYKASALYPEYNVRWLIPELLDGSLSTREDDPYLFTEEDRQYVLDTVDFWDNESLSAKVNPYIPEEYRRIAKNSVLNFTAQDICPQPIGHFAPNFRKCVELGFGAVRAEAEEKMAELLAAGLPGGAAKYNFYQGVAIVCGGMIAFAKRYAAEAARQAAECTDPGRRKELERIADTMGRIMDGPAESFRDAVQAVWFYQMCILMDANMHGASIGRLDQVLGPYAEADLAAGAITRDEAQELMDLFYLKIAECNKIWGARNAKSSPGYTSGQLITVGGVTKDGGDATNAVTYMSLEAMGRLKLHSPSQALRLHDGTPKKLWECAIEVNKINGGVPSFYSDRVVMESLERRGIRREDVWDYCLIGCVEPSVGGAEWPACGGVGINTYVNFVNMFTLAINDGKSYCYHSPAVDTQIQLGPHTGFLYNMRSIEEVMAAYRTQAEYWTNWYAALVNIHEDVARREMPQPVISASMTGCMESGRDVMDGGAKYNSTGVSGIGLGNVAESFNVINALCFVQKKCGTRELYDALLHNWEGYEELRDYIIGRVSHYGNGDPAADRFAAFTADTFSDLVPGLTTHRGHFAAGMYPVTMNVVFGKFTPATPDSRRAGDSLSDGISAVQGFDTAGPTGALRSVTCFDHRNYTNGILLNMKFHPTALQSADGVEKLISVMKTYFFDMGGMEMQMNIISAETLRDAQTHPENYRDLVVRVAGFSAYFVEVYRDAQEDLIRRTELSL